MRTNKFTARKMINMKILALSALLLTAMSGFTPACHAADDAGVPIARLQAVYAEMQSFRAKFTQSLTHQESGTTEMRQGTLLFRKPLLVRWETAEPHAELVLITDKEIWSCLPDENLAYRYSL